MNGSGGNAGPNVVLMNHGKGNDGSRPQHNTDNGIQNTINLNTKNLMKPAFISEQELIMFKQNVFGGKQQPQGFQVINQKLLGMDNNNESTIPIVANSYNFA